MPLNFVLVAVTTALALAVAGPAPAASPTTHPRDVMIPCATE